VVLGGGIRRFELRRWLTRHGHTDIDTDHRRRKYRNAITHRNANEDAYANAIVRRGRRLAGYRHADCDSHAHAHARGSDGNGGRRIANPHSHGHADADGHSHPHPKASVDAHPNSRPHQRRARATRGAPAPCRSEPGGLAGSRHRAGAGAGF
jgi:hypothetical protein